MDHAVGREALEALAEYCQRFSPSIGIEASSEPECLFLNVAGVAHLFGGEEALARQVVDDFTRRGLRVRVAIADTVGAAWALGACERMGTGSEPGAVSPENLVSGEVPVPIFSQALTHEKDAGDASVLRVVPPGQSAALMPLPIELLRLPDKVTDLLRQLGIERIGQLETLPRDELAARFEPQLLQRLDQMFGRLDEPLPAHHPSTSLRADWEFEYPTDRLETIEQVLDRLIEQIAARLVCQGHGLLRLECRITRPPDKPARLDIGVFEPTVAVNHLSQLARLQMERLRWTTPVTAISVEATMTAPLMARQQELFTDGATRREPRQLSALLDRLGSRLGRHAVQFARLKADAQPELAWQYDPVIGRSPRRRPRRDRLAMPPRPLRLLTRPVRLASLSVLGGDPPKQFCFDGREHRVARVWGPERIETGWWRGQAVGRDYFRVETVAGSQFWLYRRLRDGRWFFHGMFE